MDDLSDRVAKAIALISQHGQPYGADESAWLIDQILQTLAGQDYEDWVEMYETTTGITWYEGCEPTDQPGA